MLADELISRLTVQTCLQRGLSLVCTELLNFTGDEIYFSKQAELVGHTYLEAQLAFADSVVIGIFRVGKILLNPVPNELIIQGDELIVISTDDSAIHVAEIGTVDETAINQRDHVDPKPERLLVLGYNDSLQWMLDDLANYVTAGSSVLVASSVANPTLTVPAGLEMEVIHVDTTSRAALDRLGIGNFQHVLVLAYRDLHDTQVADAQTLVTLLHLRDMADRENLQLNVVSEMIDDRNRELAEATRPDDFIVSSRLVSLMLTQVSENPALIEVFEQLFSGAGCEIYVRPASEYVKGGTEVDFYTICAAAAQRQETAIGFRSAADSRIATEGYGVHLNPTKTERRTFAADDSVIVLAASS